MEKLGYLFRKIRKEKHLSMEYVCKNIISIAALSKYERGESDITFSNFIKILDRINVSLEEFLSMVNDENLNQQSIYSTLYAQAIKNKDTYSLLSLYRDKYTVYNDTSNIKYLHQALLAKFQYNKLKEISHTKEDISTISSYLFQVENWGMYELSLFGNFLEFLPLTTVELLIDSSYKKTASYNELIPNQNVLLRIFINFLTLLIDTNQLDKSNYYLKIADKISQNSEYSIYEKLYLNALKSLMKIYRGDIINGKKEMEDIIFIFRSLELYDEARLHQEQLEKIVNSTIVK